MNHKSFRKIAFLVLFLFTFYVFGFIIVLNQQNSSDNALLKTAELSSDKKIYSSYETPTFKLSLKQNTSTASLVESVFAQNGPTVKARFVNDADKKTIINASISQDSPGNYIITPSKTNSFKPGKYTILTIVQTQTAQRDLAQDFAWGVLALNPDKATYNTGETSNISIGVLDDKGEMVCNANVVLIITNPDGTKEKKTTGDGSIKVYNQCHSKAESLIPDYGTQVKLGGTGTYLLNLSATTKNGRYTIQDYIKVSDNMPFDIQRQSATRLYPKNEYPMIINVRVDQDFKGTVSETVPSDFAVRKTMQDDKTTDFAAVTIDKKTYRLINWNVSWKKGEKHTLTYIYQSPDRSPEFFLLGNLQLINSQSSIVYSENRYWQIANDSTQIIITSSSNPITCGANCATIPSDWSTTNTIEVIGGGGNGVAAVASGRGGAGGGGGGYSIKSNQSLSGNVAFNVGVAGGGPNSTGDSYFCNSASNCTTGATFGSAVISGAHGGTNGSTTTGGVGGSTTNAVGDTKYAGGTGGNASSTIRTPGAGGGGAGGPNGAGGGGAASATTAGRGGSGGGGNGGRTTTGGYPGATATTTTGGTGGNNFSNTTGSGGSGGSPGGTGTNGGGGGGGTGLTAAGTAGKGGTGSMGSEWGSQGTGGGAGGGGSNSYTTSGTRAGGAGGTPPANTGAGGGGGGGATTAGGAGSGSNGFIVINYTPSGINVSENAYSTGTTPSADCGASNYVSIAVNGTTYAATNCSASDGSFTFTSIALPSAGNQIVIWLTGSTKGAVIDRYDGSGDSTNNILYDNQVAVTSDDTNAVTNSTMSTYDGGSDGNIPYTHSGSAITISSGFAFLAELKSGVTGGSTVYSPGGTITTNTTGGDFIVGTNVTATLDTATNSIGGNVTIGSGQRLMSTRIPL